MTKNWIVKGEGKSVSDISLALNRSTFFLLMLSRKDEVGLHDFQNR